MVRHASRREAAMAKLYATEAAQEVIDMAVQLHGGDGVRHGSGG
jgi:acyl-CoA dehydrogenase